MCKDVMRAALAAQHARGQSTLAPPEHQRAPELEAHRAEEPPTESDRNLLVLSS